jgi:hypothetical protein
VRVRVDAGGLTLTGEGGFLPEMIKAVLERVWPPSSPSTWATRRATGPGAVAPNSRNGTTPKTVATEVGDVPLAVPRDRAATFEPRLVPNGARRAGGLDDTVAEMRSRRANRPAIRIRCAMCKLLVVDVQPPPEPEPARLIAPCGSRWARSGPRNHNCRAEDRRSVD